MIRAATISTIVLVALAIGAHAQTKCAPTDADGRCLATIDQRILHLAGREDRADLNYGGIAMTGTFLRNSGCRQEVDAGDLPGAARGYLDHTCKDMQK
jgi:hypothetical protein